MYFKQTISGTTYHYMIVEDEVFVRGLADIREWTVLDNRDAESFLGWVWDTAQKDGIAFAAK